MIRQRGDHITIVVPKGASSRVPGFGRGELLLEQHDGSRVFRYNVHKVKKTLSNLMQEAGREA